MQGCCISTTTERKKQPLSPISLKFNKMTSRLVKVWEKGVSSTDGRQIGTNILGEKSDNVYQNFYNLLIFCITNDTGTTNLPDTGSHYQGYDLSSSPKTYTTEWGTQLMQIVLWPSHMYNVYIHINKYI